MSAVRAGDVFEPSAWTGALDPEFWRRGIALHRAPCAGPGTLAAAGVDRIVTGASLLLGLSLAPALGRGGLEGLVAELDYYSQPKRLADPAAFFEVPPGGVAIAEREAPSGWRDPADARRVVIEFESPFQTVHPGHREAYRRFSPNERVQCRAWLHRERVRPVVVTIHGFGVPDYTVNAELFFARRLFELGLDIVHFTLPFHGARRPWGAWFHGQHFVGLALWRLNEACAQAVMDLRILLRHLRERGAPAVGVTGYSLGGYHSALLAGLDASLDFAIPVAPVASIADLLFEWPVGWVLRALLRNPEDAIVELRRGLALHTPLSHPLQIARERALILGGLGDRMAPPGHAQLLFEHWGCPRLCWMSGSHLLPLHRGRWFRVLVEFLASIELLPAPKRGGRRGAR